MDVVVEKPHFDPNEPCDIEYEAVKFEPESKVLDNTTRNMQLKVDTKCDEPVLVCSLKNISFKPTMM